MIYSYCYDNNKKMTRTLISEDEVLVAQEGETLVQIAELEITKDNIRALRIPSLYEHDDISGLPTLK